MVIYLERKMERLDSGDFKDHVRKDFVHSQQWSDEMWKREMAKGGGNKKWFQYCTDPLGQEILYFRALQGHSGHNLMDLSLQDNVFIPNEYSEYIYHIGCAINLLSIVNSDWYQEDKFWAKDRQTVFLTAVDPINREHKDPHELEETSKHGVFGLTSNLLKRKDWSSIKRDRTPSSCTRHSSLLYPEGYHDAIWRSHIRESICFTSTSSKDFI